MKATWFGSADHPLFGRAYIPYHASARAGVVLCPPVGLEGTSASRTYKVLGERLAREGFAVLRVDYEGTGDSSGSGLDGERVSAWVNSIREGVDLVRSSGARTVAGIGMRLGATLLASVAGLCDLDSLVLWDPCESGRSYLREQQTLWSLHLGDSALASTTSPRNRSALFGPPSLDEPGTVEVLGELYSAATVQELSNLSIESARGNLAREVLVLNRPNSPPRRSLLERMADESVEWGEARGQEDLVDVQPGKAQVPMATIEEIASWLSETLGGAEQSSFRLPARTVAALDNGITEEIVRLGPLGLFGVLTHASDPRSEVTAVILNSGNVDHVGPGRLWVHMARHWGRLGISTLRVDLSGLGDSPVRPGQEEDVVYPPEFFDDLQDISRAVSPEDPSAIVLVGLCSGGYHSVEGGITMGARGVCLVNPILPRNPLNQPNRTLAPRPPDPRRMATAARKAWVRKLPAHDRLASFGDKLPSAAWWLFDRVGVELPPARALGRLVERGVDTFVVCGDHEARVITRGETGVLRRLRRTGRFRLEVLPGIDHELFQRSAREVVEPMLTGHLIERFATRRSVETVKQATDHRDRGPD